MSEIINIYCDESCHLEKDRQPLMVLGAVSCRRDKAPEIAKRIREIKQKHGLPPYFEAKWTKVSPAKLNVYKDLIDYFFDDDDLTFRGLIAQGKDRLRHEAFGQDHDTWYYKMYFRTLSILFSPEQRYHVYLDIKDTQSARKIRHLHEVLCNNIYDFDRSIIERLQTVRSHEVEQLQLTDLLIGALSYVNRRLETSPAKIELVDRIRKRSGYTLTRRTLYGEKKFNIFVWQPDWRG